MSFSLTLVTTIQQSTPVLSVMLICLWHHSNISVENMIIQSLFLYGVLASKYENMYLHGNFKVLAAANIFFYKLHFYLLLDELPLKIDTLCR